MGDPNREDQTQSTSKNASGTGRATGSPSEGERTDAVLHQANDPVENTNVPPAGLENDLPGVDAHGAEEGERDRPEPRSEAEAEARRGVDKAFSDMADSEREHKPL